MAGTGRHRREHRWRPLVLSADGREPASSRACCAARPRPAGRTSRLYRRATERRCRHRCSRCQASPLRRSRARRAPRQSGCRRHEAGLARHRLRRTYDGATGQRFGNGKRRPRGRPTSPRSNGAIEGEAAWPCATCIDGHRLGAEWGRRGRVSRRSQSSRARAPQRGPPGLARRTHGGRQLTGRHKRELQGQRQGRPARRGGAHRRNRARAHRRRRPDVARLARDDGDASRPRDTAAAVESSAPARSSPSARCSKRASCGGSGWAGRRVNSSNTRAASGLNKNRRLANHLNVSAVFKALAEGGRGQFMQLLRQGRQSRRGTG